MDIILILNKFPKKACKYQKLLLYKNFAIQPLQKLYGDFFLSLHVRFRVTVVQNE